MVEIVDMPLLIVVAGAAAIAEASRVAIIGPVTAGAISWDMRLQVAGAMAVGAGEARMPAKQRESGLARVIELLRGPADRRMAITALSPLRALVHIIRHVTADAARWRALVVLTGVTGGAGETLMFVGQRKRSFIVIEGGLLPGSRTMT